MILAYRVLTNLLYPLIFIFIYFRVFLKKEDPNRFREKLLSSHFKVDRKNNRKLIWFHAASVGELKSIFPIIESLSNNKSYEIEFLVTTTTLSSSNLAKEELKNFINIRHRFFPVDVKFLIKRFLLKWKPDKIFLIDSEVWPNLILTAKNYKIPIALLNARLTSKSFKKWQIFPETAKRIFNIFDLCLTSNLETKNYLKQLGAKNIYFKGNIKLIDEVKEKKIHDPNEKFLSNNRFWIASSIHNNEDIFCLKTHLILKERYDDIVTIIAPRHIEKSNNIKSLCENFNLSAQILNKNEKILKNKEIIIINSFGDLHKYYKHAKSVFMGKSTIDKLKSDSGQNPIEAAKLNCKIYHGPYVYNFKEIYEFLKTNNISHQINSYNELSTNLITDLYSIQKNIAEKSNLIKNFGEKTLADTMKSINNFLFDDNK